MIEYIYIYIAPKHREQSHSYDRQMFARTNTTVVYSTSRKHAQFVLPKHRQQYYTTKEFTFTGMMSNLSKITHNIDPAYFSI